MFGWPLVVLALFATMRPRRAVIASVVIGWLFLPMSSYKLGGVLSVLPNYSKLTATSLAIVLAALVFDAMRLLRFRPRIWDAPMALWCLAPLASSLSNGLGVYDGLSGVLNQTILWGLPYFLGRVYFTDLQSVRELALAILIGGLVYLPLCLWEIKMSPQLHRVLYGFHQHDFIQSKRGATYRPMVFLQHGLAVGMYMATASLIALSAWLSGALRRIKGVPMWVIAPVLIATTVLCKSWFAVVLMMMGIGVLVAIRLAPARVWIAGLVAVPVLYVTARTAGGWSGEHLVEAAKLFGENRAASIATRIRSENVLWEHASAQPWFGWAGWGRALVYDHSDKMIAVPDGLWIIAVGQNGLFGLTMLFAAIMVGPLLVLRRFRGRELRLPAVAPLTALTVVLALHLCDSVLNAMVNPLFIMALGGAVSIGALRRSPATVMLTPAAAARAAAARPRRTRVGELPRRPPRAAAEGAPW